jgi:hypothetical protein
MLRITGDWESGVGRQPDGSIQVAFPWRGAGRFDPEALLGSVPAKWLEIGPARGDGNRRMALEYSGLGVECTVLDITYEETPIPRFNGPGHAAVEYGSGWPWTALRATRFGDRVGGSTIWDRWRAGVDCPVFLRPRHQGPDARPGGTGRPLALGVVWKGLAEDTGLFAGLLLLAGAGRAWTRGRRYSRRGLCPACAYPVGVSERCTECGIAVARGAAAVIEVSGRTNDTDRGGKTAADEDRRHAGD